MRAAGPQSYRVTASSPLQLRGCVRPIPHDAHTLATAWETATSIVCAAQARDFAHTARCDSVPIARLFCAHAVPCNRASSHDQPHSACFMQTLLSTSSDSEDGAERSDAHTSPSTPCQRTASDTHHSGAGVYNVAPVRADTAAHGESEHAVTHWCCDVQPLSRNESERGNTAADTAQHHQEIAYQLLASVLLTAANAPCVACSAWTRRTCSANRARRRLARSASSVWRFSAIATAAYQTKWTWCMAGPNVASNAMRSWCHKAAKPRPQNTEKDHCAANHKAVAASGGQQRSMAAGGGGGAAATAAVCGSVHAPHKGWHNLHRRPGVRSNKHQV